MPKRTAVVIAKLAANNTVKVSAVLQQRIVNAMKVEGFTVWSEFCRVALTEKCHHTEGQLRASNPEEFQRVYPKPEATVPLRGNNSGRFR